MVIDRSILVFTFCTVNDKYEAVVATILSVLLLCGVRNLSLNQESFILIFIYERCLDSETRPDVSFEFLESAVPTDILLRIRLI